MKNKQYIARHPSYELEIDKKMVNLGNKNKPSTSHLKVAMRKLYAPDGSIFYVPVGFTNLEDYLSSTKINLLIANELQQDDKIIFYQNEINRLQAVGVV